MTESSASPAPATNWRELAEEAADFIEHNVGLIDTFIDYDGKRELLKKIRAASETTVSETACKPVDPDSEAANPVWDLVIAKCHSAYPEREGMQWGESPLELITEIINDRDEQRHYLERAMANHNADLNGTTVSARRCSTDTGRMDWLEMMDVEVRTPRVYGSSPLFFVGPEQGDGDETPSNIRKQIDYQRNGGEKP